MRSYKKVAQKKRLDNLIVELGYAQSRERAKALIMSGIVFVDGQKVDKAGFEVKDEAKIEVHGSDLKYVSRGGLKLEKAVDKFGVKLAGLTCMDIGASTGGFTDCMLQNGAVKVFSVDVGYGQLAWKLRSDERVVNMERTNIRYVTKQAINDELDFASIDVSFISLTLVLPVARELLKADGEIVCLVKPQFEAGKGKVGKKGVVREPEIHVEVIKKIFDFATENGFNVLNIDFSPVKGPEGNIEYLMHLKKSQKPQEEQFDIEAIVADSHNTL